MPFLDVIAGIVLDKPPMTVLSGALVCTGGVTVDGRFWDGPLVDDGRPAGAVTVSDGERSWSVTVLQGADDSLVACRDVEALIRRDRLEGWQEHEIARLVPPIVDYERVVGEAAETPVEHVLRTRAAELQKVYLEPFAELRLTALVLPAERAARLSRRAIQRLATHSEDWHRATVAGVEPRRIEGLRREEGIDVYENRLAARLLDHVHAELKRRQARLARYAESSASHAINGHHRKRDRLASLWAEAGAHDMEAMRRSLSASSDRVSSLARRTARFRTGRLYRNVPRRASVSEPIRVTNLLRSDRGYRAVMELRAAARTAGQVRDRHEVRAERLEDVRAFKEFTWLLAARAVLDLGNSEAAVSVPNGFEVRTRWGSLRCQRGSDDHELAIITGAAETSATVLRIVPVPADVLTLSEEFLTVGLRSLALTSAQHATIALYPGTGGGLASVPAEVAAAAWPSNTNPARRVTPVPVSPLDLDSLERVARAVRWFVISRALLLYPFSCPFPSRHAALASHLKAAEHRSGTLTLSGVPGPEERAAFAQAVEQTRRKLVGHGDQAGAEGLLELAGTVDGLAQDLTDFLACPTCGAIAARFQPRTRRTFEAACRSCNTVWGIRHDPAASQHDRVPYLWLQAEPLPTSPAYRRTWAGRDLLADPCEAPDVSYGQAPINPWTGICPRASATRECARCEPSAVPDEDE